MAAASGATSCLLHAMFGIGIGELLVVLVVVLLIFGPGRLPEMMGNFGRAMRDFQKGLREPPEVEKGPENPTPSAEGKREGDSAKA